MDADSVPFIKPVDFLDIEDYKKTGCHFFRDRETLEQFPDVFKKIFYNLFPRDIETVLFGIPQLTPHTLENKFFKHNARHFVESGIVLMDRKSHLLGMLMSIHLQFWGPLNTFLYGEKEIFWLGQSIAGNEQYSYNINPVGAIGPITTSEHKIADSAISVQPAHIGSDNHTLLWVNSGLETCKRHSWTHDFKNNRKLNKEFGSEDNLKNHYLSPLQIDGVIIPPDATRYYDNKINEPKRGWEQRSDLGCEGYLWAAYSNVGDDKNGARGKEVRFSEDEKKYYNKIASIWTSELDE
ncbi:hypothetical protein PACTADRAFT_50301 [Pachysolen tannophilus NRRL Y-2460]|uniref:Uncharacterized protein n=1 Tax=Pachysolen tannophilus NRRL Y-2460 TaxID=669874 RepID=A0A1E4TV13_PACTA|nr:hypothetical protein PACTADRAFT_50301 [Pachysolen tannophilus NRRL Y-2460]